MTKIILLNFTQSQAQSIAKAGYLVDRGYLGEYQRQEYLPFEAPHPLYEYDIMVYNSEIAGELETEFANPSNLLKVKGCLEALKDPNVHPLFRISFLGGPTGLSSLLQGGVPYISLSRAERNVSSFVENNEANAMFAIPEMHRLVWSLRKDIDSVRYFLTPSDTYPFYHFAPILSRHAEEIAAYGTTPSGKTLQTLPRYIALPKLKDNAKAVVQILQVLEGAFPELFPESSKNLWLEADEFMLSDERAKDLEIRAKVAETSLVLENMKLQRSNIAKENKFIRQLLVATEDVKLEPSDRLSTVVRKTLEYLGFNVEDIDEKTKTAIKKEDFWVSDGNFFAITEVTGTVNVNPKTKEYNDILGRLTTIFKRQTDLVPRGISNLTGLLVLNYDSERHPSKRPKAYTGDLEHIVEAAVEQNIGILSTVELHKIVVDVKEGKLAKQDARSLLKQFGRIEYKRQD